MYRVIISIWLVGLITLTTFVMYPGSKRMASVDIKLLVQEYVDHLARSNKDSDALEYAISSFTSHLNETITSVALKDDVQIIVKEAALANVPDITAQVRKAL